MWELVNEIHKFWQTLNCNVQSLGTLGKLSGCLSMLRGVLDKLPGISGSRELGETRMASLGIREASAIFEERKSLHQIEVKKSVHTGSLHTALTSLSSASTTAASSSHSSRKQSLCASSRISLTTRVCLLRSRDSQILGM